MMPLPSDPLMTVMTVPSWGAGAGTFMKRLRTGKPTSMTRSGSFTLAMVHS